MNIKELRQESAELVQKQTALKARGRAVLASQVKGQPLAEDQEKEFETVQAELTGLDRRMAQVGQDIARWETVWEEQKTEKAIATGGDEPGGAATKLPTPFRSFGEQLQSVARYYQRHTIDPRLSQIQAAVQGASEGISSDGGFLVQTDFTGELLRLVHQTGVLAQRTDRKPISANSNGIKINAVDETSRADGSRWGGVQAYWTAEGAALTGTKPKYRQMELSLQKLTGLYYATDELLMDVTALGAFASDAFAEEFGFKIDDAIIRGTGGGMPLGILAHAGTVSVGKETGQAAATIVATNIEKMYSRLWTPSKANAVWYINVDTWPQLFQLHHEVGTGGVPLFVPPGQLAAAPFGTLLGRPIQEIEQCETVGTVGDIILADLSQYLMIEKGGIEAASSIHVEFLTDQTVFRFIFRGDGQPKRNAPLTPYKGAGTLSSFVTLATRA